MSETNIPSLHPPILDLLEGITEKDFDTQKYIIFPLLEEKEISFYDVQKFLEDERIHSDVRSEIAKKIQKISFSEIQKFLEDERIHSGVRGKVAKKIEKVSFSEVQEFLENEKIYSDVRDQVARKIQKTSFSEVQEFLENEKIEDIVRYEIASEIQKVSFSEVQEFLENDFIEWLVRYGIASKIQKVSFSEIQKFLEDEKIHSNVRSKIAKKIQKVSFSEIQKFLEDEKIHSNVRSKIAKKIQKISFSEIQKFLENEKIENIVRYEIAGKIQKVSFSGIQEFLENDRINWDTRSQVAEKIKKVSFSEVQEFLENEEIKRFVRSEVAEKIKKASFSEVQEFLGNDCIDWRIRYEIGKKTQIDSLKKSNIENILEKERSIASKKIREINTCQLKKLSLEIAPTKDRSLVLYYREYQGAYNPHFESIARFLKKYIDEGYSPVWNQFKIVTRFGKKNKLGGIKTEPYQEDALFQKQISYMADSIQLIHGTPETTPGSHSILGTAITSNESKKGILNKIDYTPLDLLYYGLESRKEIQKNTKDTGLGFPTITIEEVLVRVLDAVKKAENSILENCGITNSISENVEEILEKKDE